MKRIFIFSLSLLVLTGCGRNQDDISGAYDRKEQLNIEVTKETDRMETTADKATETTAEELKESEAVKKPQNPELDLSGMPPRVVTIESQIMNVGDTVSYLGIELSVDKAKTAKSLDELKDFMDSEKDAGQFKTQLLNCELKSGFDDEGNVQFPDNEELIFIKCKFVNTKDEEIRLNMNIPLYCSTVDLKDIGSSKTVNMADFNMIGNSMDFYGQHDKYVNPKVGMETASSSQYHVIQPKETFETVFVIHVRADNLTDPTYYICSAILSDSIGMYNFPSGTYLIPLDMK